MFVLVTGGTGSGKSEFAENKAMSLGKSRTYIATMKPYGEEANKRIMRHRKLREGKGFITEECYLDIKKLTVSGTVLLECMSNLLANEMFSASGKNAVAEILTGIDALVSKCDNLVVVTNEVSSDGVCYDKGTEIYKKNLGEINCCLAEMADAVYEVCCGIANQIKGEEM